MAFETRFAQFTADEYFADPCDVPSLSSSIAHVIDSESPMHARARHPKFGGFSRPPTKSMDNGSLSHALLLGAGKGIKVIDAENFKKKVAQEERDAARDEGLIPVLKAEYEEALVTAEILRARFAQKGISLDGKSEVTALWSERASSGAEVQCRGMIDHLTLPRVYDIKSTRSAKPDVCRRHVESYGYAIQRAAYVSAVERIHPELAGRVDFIFVFYETEPPYDVTPVRLSGAFRELGERGWRRAVDRWEECLRKDEWPGYTSGTIELEPSPWALTRDMDRMASGDGFGE
jgi:hypothetical protein